MKRMYSVSYPVTYSVKVMAESPAEAADLAIDLCPYDIEGYAYVSRPDKNDPRILYSWDEDDGKLPEIDPEDNEW